MCMNVLPAYMSVHSMCAWGRQEPEKGVGSLGSRVTAGCELSCGCWESNLGPLEKQPVCSSTEPSLQPQSWAFCVLGILNFDPVI